MVLGLFKRKKEKKEEEEKKEVDIVGTCPVCNQPVYKTDDYKTLNFQGQRFVMHRKCFKQMKKMAMQFVKSGFGF
jgi:hypothetical protein